MAARASRARRLSGLKDSGLRTGLPATHLRLEHEPPEVAHSHRIENAVEVIALVQNQPGVQSRGFALDDSAV